MLRIHDPSHAPASGDGAAARVAFPRVAPGERVRVAFLDNEKPNTTPLLALVEAGLARRYELEPWRVLKGGAGFPAPAEMLEAIAARADVAILATAD
jgi:hypothetical protein